MFVWSISHFINKYEAFPRFPNFQVRTGTLRSEKLKKNKRKNGKLLNFKNNIFY